MNRTDQSFLPILKLLRNIQRKKNLRKNEEDRRKMAKNNYTINVILHDWWMNLNKTKVYLLIQIGNRLKLTERSIKEKK